MCRRVVVRVPCALPGASRFLPTQQERKRNQQNLTALERFGLSNLFAEKPRLLFFFSQFFETMAGYMDGRGGGGFEDEVGWLSFSSASR